MVTKKKTAEISPVIIFLLGETTGRHQTADSRLYRYSSPLFNNIEFARQ
jgi:hypothetical protein